MGNLKKLIDLTLLRTYTNIVKGLIGTRASQSDLTTHTSDSTVHVTSAEKQTWNGKQDSLTFDEVPTEGSSNPVKSGGVYSAIEDAKDAVRNAIQVTTSELRNLKANSNLIPGMNYKITDYNPTVTGIVRIAQKTLNISNQLYLKNNSRVAPFDIVLTALSKKDLSEKGFAIGKNYVNRQTRQLYNGYWGNTNFTAWELNVIVDSYDERRPDWCQEEDAPVWISYMKDEWGNEAPFDFKTYGISLPEDVTIDETYNSEELDNNNVWLKGNRWHIFTYYDNDDFAYDSSLEGYVKNVKITDWNIIIGGIIDSKIEGDANILINSNDINDELYSNVRIVGYGNRMFGSAPDYGDGNIIQGSHNIVVSSIVTTEGHNSYCIIKNSESIYLGNYNDNIVIRNCSEINIGDSNVYWNLSHSNQITIGDRNEGIVSAPCYIKETLTEDTDEGAIIPGTNITVGNDNVGIFLAGCQKCSIGSKNNNIWMSRDDKDGELFEYITIGDYNESINLGGWGVSEYSTIGNHNKNITTEYGLFNVTIGNENENFNFDERISYSVIGSCNTDIEVGGGTLDNVTIGDNNRNIYLTDLSDVTIGDNNGSGKIETINGIQYDNRNRLYLEETQHVTIGNDNCNYLIERQRVNTWSREGISFDLDEIYAGIRVRSFTHDGRVVTIGNGNNFLDLYCDTSEFSIGDSNFGIKLNDYSNVTIGNHNTYIKCPGENHKIMIGNENKKIVIDDFPDAGVQGLIIGSYCENVGININWDSDAEYAGDDVMLVNYVIENHSRAVLSNKIHCTDNYTGPSIHFYYENDWKIFHINNIQN